jgi:predicted oxidoreductase (fatty acid repression mutant protein)
VSVLKFSSFVSCNTMAMGIAEHEHDTHPLSLVSLPCRFRQEYRLERKLLNELAADPESVSIGNQDVDAQPSAVRHRISRVVILHNDKLETFFNPDHISVEKKVEPSGDDFFDNDSFWSGSITWY